MKFGLFFTMDHYDHLPITPEQHLRHTALQVEAAEALGFDSVWFTEQHFNQMDGLCSDPIAFMSNMAARTARIRLGSAVTLPALDHPIRLAESYSLLDVLSGGRIDVGVGANSIKQVYEVYGASYERRRELRDEAVDVMCGIWEGHEDSLARPGEKLQHSDVRLGLYPVQKPHPPIWVATGTLPRIATVLQCGHSVLFDYQYSDFDAGEAVSMKAEGSPSCDGSIAGVIYAQLADLDNAFSHYDAFFGDFLAKLRGPGFRVENEWLSMQSHERILCCTVADALHRVERIAEQGLDQLLLGVGFGGMSHTTVMSTIEAFSNTIMPIFR